MVTNTKQSQAVVINKCSTMKADSNSMCNMYNTILYSLMYFPYFW